MTPRPNRDRPGAKRLPYDQVHQSFGWAVPEVFNMAQVCCRRWAQASDASKRVAIQVYDTRAGCQFHSYAELQEQADRLSAALRALGVHAGMRVAIVLPQCLETAVAYMAVLQMGAVAVPLSMLFGPQALAYRLSDSGAVLAFCEASKLAELHSVRAQLPTLSTVVAVGGDPLVAPGADCHWTPFLAAQEGAAAHCAPTRADDAAVLIYTSGTTGDPKGALIPHRALIGNLSGFVASQDWFGFDPGGAPCGALPSASTAVFWSPADWAWTGGLMDALLPTLYFGRPIVACRARFSADLAMTLLRDCAVTHSFLFPTALKTIMKAYPGTARRHSVRRRQGLQLQALMSAGEALGDTVFTYCVQQLGVTPNEMFGQTEINYIVGNCQRLWPPKPGSMGRAYPGHRVQVLDDDGNVCAVGVPGDVAVHRLDVHGEPDPVFFLGYWNNPAATAAKFSGDWCRTGDLALRDADGYLWYQGRSDDVFKSSGYRIGPGEIENCLLAHPAVANAAVVPKPDPARGAVVKAYLVLAPEWVVTRPTATRARAKFDQQLVAALQAHVRGLLAPYEYPKDIEFVDALPMTTTGKVQRRVLRLQELERAKAVR